MSTEPSPANPPDESFSEAVLGKSFFQNGLVKRFRALAPEWQVSSIVTALSSLLFIPYLGAVGLWDCWEPHYGEVARQMIQRNDYVLPWWESSWFFSKPPLTMWMTALGMQVVGTNRAPVNGPVALYTEWGMRLPIALYSIFALALVAFVLTRLVSKRVGLAFGAILATMPLYFLLSRQAVTDLPLVASVMCALGCAMIGQLDETTKHRTAWWYGFYFFCGLGVLAKELLGVALPATTLLLYAVLCVIPWTMESFRAHARWLVSRAERAKVRRGELPMPMLWDQLYKMKLGSGVVLFFLVCAPWYALMFPTTGVDDENERFWFRVIFHDNFNRLAEGVHTTTPGGNFTYFITQGGYAMFPWIVLLPGAIALVAAFKLRGGGKREHVARLATIWTALSFFVVASSATKFHHYIFPALPGMAILFALFAEKLWKDGIAEHAVSLILGGIFFVLIGKDLSENPKNFTDLFVYNYDRAYPHFLDTRPIQLSAGRSLWVGDLIAVSLLAIGLYVLVEALGKKGRVGGRVGGMLLGLCGAGVLLATSNAGKFSPGLGIALALVGTGLYLAYETLSGRVPGRPGWVSTVGLLIAGGLAFVLLTPQKSGTDPFLRALQDPVSDSIAMGYAFTACAVLCVAALALRTKVMLYGVFLALAIGFAGWFNWSHWVDLSHHWTQRDLFWRYYRLRQSPDEPIAAFLMNWRGETFYSRNTVKQIREKTNERMRAYADQPGTKWALVEHYRVGLLENAVGPTHHVSLIDRDINNKFVLVKIE